MAEVPPADAAAVDMVLNAPDHYASLSLRHDVPQAEIRKAYIKASVQLQPHRALQVHPDRNRHPDATAAFQRVAAAWEILSDSQARAGYDNDLRTNTAPDPFAAASSPRPAPTAEEAFASFAFATAACSSGSGGLVGDFAEVLFWAQKLSSNRSEMDAQTAAAAGLSVAAGLRVLGTVVSAVGLKGPGGSISGAATALRVAGTVGAVGVAASKNPLVLNALQAAKTEGQAQIERLGAAAERGAYQAKQLTVGGVMGSMARKAKQVQLSGEIRYLEMKVTELKKGFGEKVWCDMGGPHGMMGDGEYLDNEVVMDVFTEIASKISEYKLAIAEKKQQYDEL